jgi:type IV fimbrial biogenesis protein FimT
MLVSRNAAPQRASRCPKWGRADGFTLVELVTTITVIAVLATAAAPSFRQFMGNQRLRNAAYDLMTALAQTRSEAIRRNMNVDLRRAASTQSWDRGYRIFTSGSTTTPLLDQQAYASVSITDSSNLGSITYGRDGRASTSATVFKIAPANAVAGVTPRCVSIGLSGVPSLSVGGC